MSPSQRLQAELSHLPEVEQLASRFGSGRNPAWWVAGHEFAHLHSDDLIDLRLPLSIQRTLRDDPRAHFRNARSEWLEFEFHTLHDVEQLSVLVRQAYAAAKVRHK